MDEVQDKEISIFVRELLPDASLEELEAAQRHYEEYLDVLIRIYHRLEREGYFSTGDKSPPRANVNLQEHEAV